MKQIEAIRIELDQIRQQLTHETLDSGQKIRFENDYETKAAQMKRLRASVTSGSSRWQWTSLEADEASKPERLSPPERFSDPN
jgi:hypothetical protein